jgi:hypothetical protein
MSRVLTLTLMFASAVAVACSDQSPAPQPKLDKLAVANGGDSSGAPTTPTNPTAPTTPTTPTPDTVLTPPSQPSGIYGYVVGPVQIADSIGQAGISGVRVSLHRTGTSAEVASTTTVSGGSFAFADVADGVYVVLAIPGATSPYAPGERSDVTVRDGKMTNGGQIVIVLKKK